MEKTMKARVQHKHDIEANWLKATNFTPLASEIIVYDSDENYDYPRIKIGDGKTNINDLPFIVDEAKITEIISSSLEDAKNSGEFDGTSASLSIKYARSAWSSKQPTEWQDSIPTLTPTEKYLWAQFTKIEGPSSSIWAGVIGAYGDKGETGKTAYQYARDGGYAGTEAEFAAKLAEANFSGSYNDLSDKPTIPSIAGLASTNYVDEAVKNKVDKDGNKVLSTNDYTTAEKNKLAGIAAGAEVNVNADWNATSGDAQILNKPTLGTMAAKNSVAKSDLVSGVQTSLGKADTALQPTDISDWAKQPNKPEYGADEIILDTTDWESTEPSDATGLKLDDFLEALRKEVNTDHMNFTTHINTKSNPHSVTKKQVGLENVDNVKQYSASNPPPYPVTSVNGQTGAVMLTIPDALSDLSTDANHRVVTDAEKESWSAKASVSAIPTKVSQLQNDSKFLTSFTETDPTVPAWAKAATKPSYTKADVGLGNVDNTSDANKPVSTKQATAIADAKKAGTDAQANLDTHANNFSNPHFVTKSQLGLEKVDNVKQYSVNNPPILTQSTPPSDLNALWVDPNDNNDDGFQDAINIALAQAKSSGEFDGEDGNGIHSAVLNDDYTLTLTFNDGTSYTTSSIRGEPGPTGDDYILSENDKKEIAQQAATLVEVPEFAGFIVQNVAPEDTSVLWLDPADNHDDGLQKAINTALDQAKISGNFDGTSVTVKSVSESTEDGGSNVITFSDGKTMTVKNGSKGDKGDPYTLTNTDKSAIVSAVIDALPIYNGEIV